MYTKGNRCSVSTCGGDACRAADKRCKTNLFALKTRSKIMGKFMPFVTQLDIDAKP